MTNPMGLTIPTPGITPGPEYATEVSNDLDLISRHTHTGVANSDGYQVPSAGLNINEDLSIQSHNLTSLRSTRYANQSQVLAGVGDVGCVYEKSGDLWYNNSAGFPIQITSGNSLLILNSLNYATLTTSINHSINPNDIVTLIECNSTSNNIIITLPIIASTPTGRFYIIKDQKGTSETHAITVNPSGTDKIDQASNYIIADNHAAIAVISDGVGNWSLFAYDRRVYSNDTVHFKNGAELLIDSGSSLVINDGYLTSDSSTFSITNGIVNADLHSSNLVMTGSSLNVDSSNVFITNNTMTSILGGSQYQFGNTTGAEFKFGSTLTLDSGATLNVTGSSVNIDSSNIFLTNSDVVSILSGTQFQFGNTTSAEFRNGSTLTTNVGSTSTFGGTATFNGAVSLNAATANNGTISNPGAITSGGSFTLTGGTKILLNSRTFIKPLFYYGHSGTTNTWIFQDGIIQQNVVNSEHAQFYLDLPQGATLNSWTVTLLPNSGHGGLPAILPNGFVNKLSAFAPGIAATLASATDSSASVGAYETLHNITGTFPAATTVDNNNFYYVFCFEGESGANSITDLAFIVRINYTVTSMDDSK